MYARISRSDPAASRYFTVWRIVTLVYVLLMDDRYPSTDQEQGLRLDYDYPDVPHDLNRFLPLVKWLLAIPHFIVLASVWIAVFFVVIVAWFAILFTGRYPRGIFDFVEGAVR